MGNVVDVESQRMLKFEEPKLWLYIPSNYGFFWEKLEDIPFLHGSLPNENKWCTLGGFVVKGRYIFVMVTTNILCHCAMVIIILLSPKVENVWNVCTSNARWWQMLQRSLQCQLLFRSNLLIGMVIIGTFL